MANFWQERLNMIKTAQWVLDNCKFALKIPQETHDPVLKACRDTGSPLGYIKPIVIALMTGNKQSKNETRVAEEFMRVLTHYVHPEGVSAILKSWLPEKIGGKSVQAAKRDPPTATERALREAGFSLEDVKKAVKDQWGQERSNNRSATIYANFMNCLRHHTVPEAAMDIVKDLAKQDCKLANKAANGDEYLSTEERQEVKDRFGDTECSFLKDKEGFYCRTHRARSKSYKSIAEIPQKEVDFISSTS